MSLHTVYDDDVAGLRHDLDSLADEARARATSTESFAQALSRRLREWNLAPTDAGEKNKRDEDDTGDQSPKRARPGEESDATPPNLFDDNFEESEPPAPDPIIDGLPPMSEDVDAAAVFAEASELLTRADVPEWRLRQMLPLLSSIATDNDSEATSRDKARELANQIIARIAAMNNESMNQMTQLGSQEKDDDVGDGPHGSGGGGPSQAVRPGDIYLEEGQYNVERLLSRRQLDTAAPSLGEVEYLVKWQDYGARYNTWEGRSNLPRDLTDEYDAREGRISATGGATRITKRARDTTGGFIFYVAWEKDVKSAHPADHILAATKALRPAWFTVASSTGSTRQPDDDDDDSEDDGDDDDGDDPSQLGDETQEPDALPSVVPALVWDSGTGRARISISKGLRHLPEEHDWIQGCLEEWTTWRIYLLYTACVPNATERTAVTNAEIRQLAQDFYETRSRFYDNLWSEHAAAEGIDAEDQTERDEFDSMQRDSIRQRIQRAWAKARQFLERDEPKLEAQWRALQVMRDVAFENRDEVALNHIDDNEHPIFNAILKTWAERGRYWMLFARPRARQVGITDFLTGEGRSKRTEGVLRWWRRVHAESTTKQRLDGPYGSVYSGEFADTAESASAVLFPPDHILAQDWQRTSEIIFEHAQSRQDITLCLIATQTENSQRRNLPIDGFGQPDGDGERLDRGLYRPPNLNTARRAMLARTAVHGHLSYSCASDTRSTASSKPFEQSTGIALYRPVKEKMIALATADESSQLERRVALLLSAHYGRCNPLALWPSLLRDDPRFAELFRRRIDASEAIGQLIDYVRSSSVVGAPV